MSREPVDDVGRAYEGLWRTLHRMANQLPSAVVQAYLVFFSADAYTGGGWVLTKRVAELWRVVDQSILKLLRLCHARVMSSVGVWMVHVSLQFQAR
jgi:hypothetical protein